MQNDTTDRQALRDISGIARNEIHKINCALNSVYPCDSSDLRQDLAAWVEVLNISCKALNRDERKEI